MCSFSLQEKCLVQGSGAEGGNSGTLLFCWVCSAVDVSAHSWRRQGPQPFSGWLWGPSVLAGHCAQGRASISEPGARGAVPLSGDQRSPAWLTGSWEQVEDADACAVWEEAPSSGWRESALVLGSVSLVGRVRVGEEGGQECLWVQIEQTLAVLTEF